MGLSIAKDYVFWVLCWVDTNWKNQKIDSYVPKVIHFFPPTTSYEFYITIELVNFGLFILKCPLKSIKTAPCSFSSGCCIFWRKIILSLFQFLVHLWTSCHLVGKLDFFFFFSFLIPFCGDNVASLYQKRHTCNNIGFHGLL